MSAKRQLQVQLARCCSMASQTAYHFVGPLFEYKKISPPLMPAAAAITVDFHPEVTH